MLPLLLLSALSQAPASRIDDRPVTVAIQTDDGVLHGIRDRRVARFDDGWQAAGGPTTGDAVALAADGDRGVVALWTAQGRAELWRHSKKEAALVARLPSLPGDPKLVVQRDGTTWLTGSTRRLIRIGRDGTISTHLLEAGWLFTPEDASKPTCTGVTESGCCEVSALAGQAYCGVVQGEPTSIPAKPSPSVTVPSSCAPHTLVMQGVDGRAWFGSRDGLMVARTGVCRLRRSGLALDGVTHARFDPRGHDVLVRGEEVIILTDVERFPETNAGPPTQKGRVVSIEVRGATLAEVKVDGGAWIVHELTNSVLSIPELTAGTHGLELRALDDQLRADSTPALIDVVVR